MIIFIFFFSDIRFFCCKREKRDSELNIMNTKYRYKNLEIELIKELSNLDYYNIKTPFTSKDFWKEWQEKFNKANLTKIALRNIMRTQKLSRKDYLRVKNLLKKYEDIIYYLNSLKATALSARGYMGSYYIEFEEDDEDENEGGV